MVQERLKNLQEVHETRTYRLMGLIRQRDESSGSGYTLMLGSFLRFFNKITQFQATLSFELQL